MCCVCGQEALEIIRKAVVWVISFPAALIFKLFEDKGIGKKPNKD